MLAQERDWSVLHGHMANTWPASAVRAYAVVMCPKKRNIIIIGVMCIEYVRMYAHMYVCNGAVVGCLYTQVRMCTCRGLQADTMWPSVD